jgi:hypothetical protein
VSNETGVWNEIKPGMPKPLHSHNAVAIGDTWSQSALVCGGLDYALNSSTSACNKFSPTNSQWTTAAQLNTARSGHGMAVYKGIQECDRIQAKLAF